jgi:hypothetical protein
MAKASFINFVEQISFSFWFTQLRPIL